MFANGKCVDVHAHSMLPSYRKALEAASLGPNVRLPEWSPDLALSMMDRRGILASIYSLSVPGTHLGDDAKAKELARRCNVEAAEILTKNARLGAFATLPVPNIELACEEAVYALDVLKLDGIGLLTGYGGKYLGHADYDPLLEVLDERSAVVHVHPAVHPSTSAVTLGVPNFLLEYPFDTTRAAVNILFADVFERYPNVKFILSHGGGALPFLAWRISAIAAWQLSRPPASESFLKNRFPTKLTERVPELSLGLMRTLLKRFWYDTALVSDRGAMSAIREVADPSRILFGSDWPYAYEDTFVAEEVRSFNDPEVISASERSDIAWKNPIALFPRLDSLC